MVSLPLQPVSISWRARYLFVPTTVLSVLLIALMAPNSIALASGGAQGAAGELPFGLSSFFGSTQKADAAAKRTRVIIDLRQESRFDVRTLRNPNRVVIELPQVGMRVPRLTGRDAKGLVRHLQAGKSGPGRSRIVISVAEPVVVEKAEIVPKKTGRGAALEVMLVPYSSISKATRDTLQRASYSRLGGRIGQPPAPQRASRQNNSQGVYKPLIVIDPGHGGKDSGARKHGVNEKDVVLKFGLTLRKQLQRTRRYRVKMTRSKDVFIPLKKRRDFAEDNGAALFIAVHADYAGSRARGATIYSLRRKVANRLRQIAAAEAAREALSNGVMSRVTAKNADLRAVRGILGDLAQREVHVNLERTNVFTNLAISQMGAATTMRSKPHREAAFKVLKTAKVPSVLIELAYVSNRRDAVRLQSQRWRNQVSRSLVTAIDRYFAHSLSQIAQ